MVITWGEEKNKKLKKERGIGFEHVVIAINEGLLLNVLEHPNKKKYPNQVVLLVKIEQYVYAVPAITENENYFLKTMYPSRKYTKLYLGKEITNEKNGRKKID